MEHVKRQIQQGAGNAYYAGMQWRGITPVSYTHLTPVSYTHLTLPTILRV